MEGDYQGADINAAKEQEDYLLHHKSLPCAVL
jgi:hypothetical protein